MKIICLVVLALCVCAHAAVSIQNEADSVETHLDIQRLHLEARSKDSEITNDDQQLIAELAELEKVHGRNVVADAIRNALESLRVIVVNGNDVLPPLDPLRIPHIGPFIFTSLGVRATGNLYNFNVDGLRWYVVDSVTFNVLRLAMGVEVTVPRLTFTGSYDAHAVIALLSHSAGGNYRVFLNRIEVAINVRMGTSIISGNLFLRELEIDIVIHDITIQIEGMVGSGVLNGLINSFVQNTAQTLIREELGNVSEMLSRELFDVINEVLSNFTLDDLLG